MSRQTGDRGKAHSPEQIVRKLREADAMLSAGKTVGEALQQFGVSEPTYHRWHYSHSSRMNSGAGPFQSGGDFADAPRSAK
jgi:hypothetical protein